MSLSRRRLLTGLAAFGAAARSPGARAADALPPPIVFAHGNGDHAALWITTLWRFESNGWPRERLFAFNFTDPLARSIDAEPQVGRSSTEDQRRELAAAVDSALSATGAPKVVIVAHSRGGLTTRNFLSAPAAAVKAGEAVLCGAPNHGIFDWNWNIGSEFNGRSDFLRRLNGGGRETPPGVSVLTLRSDGYDKFAQNDVRGLGKPGVPSGIDKDSPALAGATNIVLGDLDHRETAFHPRAFREMYRFIAGREPPGIAIAPEDEVALDGLVTGFPGGLPTNRPLADATVEIFRVRPDNGERIGAPLHQKITAADGRWGPVTLRPHFHLEFVVTAPGHPATHIYRSPFPRSSSICHLRPARPIARGDNTPGAVVLMSRPRGYFGIPRDLLRFDGREPDDVTHGVPLDSISTLRLPPSEVGRAVVAEFNGERIAVRAWPASEGRVTIAELTY